MQLVLIQIIYLSTYISFHIDKLNKWTETFRTHGEVILWYFVRYLAGFYKVNFKRILVDNLIIDNRNRKEDSTNQRI